MNSKNNIRNRFNIKSIPHLLVLMMVSVSLITFVGCGSDDPTTAGPPGDNGGNNEEPMNEQGPDEVWIEGNSFNVSNLEVSAGTTVTWTNNSSVAHTVTSGNRDDSDAGSLFNSGSIPAGGTFSHTFEDAGSFEYFCEFHPAMSAEVTVTE